MARKKKKVLTEHQWALLRILGEQLCEARERAGLTGEQLGPMAGYETHSMVSRVERGKVDTVVSNVLSWAEACGYEVLVTPRGSVPLLAARLDQADEGERLLALRLLELLAEARLVGDEGRTLRRVSDDIDEAAKRLARHRALDAS